MRISHHIALLLTILALSAGCARTMSDPARATASYPAHLHQAQSVDIQVFRDGTTIELVNATPRTYRDFDLWVNQRYVRHVESLPAGERITLSLWDFWDERGEVINAGGFWRTRAATPVRMVEIQLGEDEPMLGLIAIPSEAPPD